MSAPVTILGIETSCDDTSVCLMRGVPGSGGAHPEILAFESFSQEMILKKWGGVVPEIAARNHMIKLVPLLEESFEKSGLTLNQVDMIGITTLPGLLGPLLTGLSTAKTMALYLKRPLVPVNHLLAHLEAIHIDNDVRYPYLGVIVSGGHSLFILMHSPTDVQILGGTIDDAAGEAFDKGGKLLGLGYPAGKIIDDLSVKGNPKAFDFPIAMKNSGDATLSYSGIKTSMRNLVEARPQVKTDQQL
jgi:N6-L-threonylcarbamoyladenine synthase